MWLTYHSITIWGGKVTEKVAWFYYYWLYIFIYLFAYLFGTFFFFCPYYVALHDLSSLTRDWTWVTAVKAPSPNHWTSRDLLLSTFLTIKALMRIISYCCSGKTLHYSLCFSFLQAFDKKELLECIRQLVRLDEEWVPYSTSASLYIRPTFIGTEVHTDFLFRGTLVGSYHCLCLCETSSR